jgi:RNA polymerase sigma factor (sigma-70 family)
MVLCVLDTLSRLWPGPTYKLMLDVKAVDTASFDLLLQKYRTPLVNFLCRMVRDTATAEDLAREVFLRIYRARKDYFAGAKFTAWLFRIATNLALNSVRDNRYRRMEVSLDAPAEEDEAPIQVPKREMRISARAAAADPPEPAKMEQSDARSEECFEGTGAEMAAAVSRRSPEDEKRTTSEMTGDDASAAPGGQWEVAHIAGNENN